MTAADEGLRAALAEALPESLGPISLRRPSPPLAAADDQPEPRGYGDQLLDALLPTVRAAMDRRAAEAIREAAVEARHGFINSRNDEGEQWARWLERRADALAPEDAEVRRG